MNTSQKIPELLDALPTDLGEGTTPEGAMAELLRNLAHRPVPTGRLVRLWALGTLQAKIAAGYLAYWLKSGCRAALLTRTGLAMEFERCLHFLYSFSNWNGACLDRLP